MSSGVSGAYGAVQRCLMSERLDVSVSWILKILLLLVGLGLLLYLTSTLVIQPTWISIDDFIEYWGAGRLNLTRGDPYDPVQLESVQLQVGRTLVMMWNPPWMLTFVMPFAVPPYAVGRSLWLITHLALAFWATEQVHRLYHVPDRYRWLSWLVGLSFGPILQALRTGQSGILMLVGVVGFLYGVLHKRYLLAGALVSLTMIKPHVLYLFPLAILLWSIRKREWRILAGGALALLVTSLLPWIINPEVWREYFYATSHYPPVDWATPTLGGLLRFVFGIDRFWLQFVGPGLGGVWFFFYWRRYGEHWEWREHLPLLLLISVATAAYGWSSDQSVLLVAVLPVILGLVQRPWNVRKVLSILAYLLINFLVLSLRVQEFWMWWLALAYLGWYLLATRVVDVRKALAEG
mgnify:CR=1 FL=1